MDYIICPACGSKKAYICNYRHQYALYCKSCDRLITMDELKTSRKNAVHSYLEVAAYKKLVNQKSERRA